MSKKQATEVVKPSAKCSGIAKAMGEALESLASQTANIVTHVCDKAKEAYGGEDIPEVDAIEIARLVSVDKGWPTSGAKKRSGDSRRSEVRAILRAYTSLGKACDLFHKRVGTFNWHDGVALARAIPKAKTVNAAVTQVCDKKASGKTTSPLVAFNDAMIKFYNSNAKGKRADALRAAIEPFLDVE